MTALHVAFGLLAAVPIAIYAFEKLAPARAATIGLAFERRRAGLVWDSVTIPGAEMPYLEGGHGETIVLLHSFAGDKDNFIRTAVYLTRHYHVVIPDLPGFGEATRDAGAQYSIGQQAANLHAFLYKLGLDRVHLGGNAMGGFVATEYAAHYPAQVASLWLLYRYYRERDPLFWMLTSSGVLLIATFLVTALGQGYYSMMLFPFLMTVVLQNSVIRNWPAWLAIYGFMAIDKYLLWHWPTTGRFLEYMRVTYGWSLLLIVVFVVLYFRYLDAKADGRLDDGIDPPWVTPQVPRASVDA